MFKGISSYICSSPEKGDDMCDGDKNVKVENKEEHESATELEGLDANLIYKNWRKLKPGSELPR